MQKFKHVYRKITSLRYEKPLNIALVSSYVPRKCGIATFSRDLGQAIKRVNSNYPPSILAIDQNDNLKYPKEVAILISHNNPQAYRQAAHWINSHNFDALCLQHEFGLYGQTEAGELILELLQRVNIPILTTLHTILDAPSPAHALVFQDILKMSDHIVVTSADAKTKLESFFVLPNKKISLIHHGVTPHPKASCSHKSYFGWNNRPVLLISGLISPDKGIEYVLPAICNLRRTFPNILLAIVGETHPDIYKREGDVYRDHLREQISRLGIKDHVQMYNKYYDLPDLLKFYEACDIYLTPHLNPSQVSSGTLAYALGMGKACISTSYAYAKDMLGSGRGILVNFRDSLDLEVAIANLLSRDSLRKKLENNAYSLGQDMTWPKVAAKYLNLFKHLSTVKLPDTVLNKTTASKLPVRQGIGSGRF